METLRDGNLCITGETIYQCSKIDYFSKEEYSPDPNDSTLAIPYTVTRSILFFLMGSLLLSIGYIFCILGQCLRHKTLYTFVAGVIFIVTGLVMLFGLIMYISIFKSEIGSKLRPRSQLQPPAFDYAYGYSFLLYVSGLIGAKLTGVSCVFLFIHRIQYEWRRKQLEAFKRGKRPLPVNNFSPHVDPGLFYPCRRHPQAYINSNSAIQANNRGGLQLSPCGVHQVRSQSNSLKDISSFYEFPPPPPAISYQFVDRFAIPRDFTSNTVSTTAEVVGNDDYLTGAFDDYSPSIQRENEFVTFDLDEALPLRAPSMVSISSRGAGRTVFETEGLRRTTPV